MKIQANPLPQQPQEPQQQVQRKEPKVPQLEQAAKMYEHMFLNEMVKAMRQATPKSDLIEENMAQKIYEDHLYDKYVEDWTAMGGVGLSDLIYDQMMLKFGDMIRRQNLQKPNIQKPTGPFPTNGTQKIEMKSTQDNKSNTQVFHFRPHQEQREAIPLTMPWAGKLVASNRLDNGQNILKIQHDNNLSSTLVFQGIALAQSPDKTLSSGERLGIITPDSQEVVWRVESS